MRPFAPSLGSICVAITLAGGPAEARAQRLSLAPEIGFYIPTEHLLQATGGQVADLEAGPSFGARLSLSFGSRIGIGVTGAWIPTTFALSTSGGQPEKRDARLFNGSGQLMVFLLPMTSPLALFLNGGLGVVSRGGIAFTEEAKRTDLAGVFGAGASIRLGGVALTVGADLFRYRASYAGTNVTSSELQQLDVQLKLGLGFPLGGGASGGPMLR